MQTFAHVATCCAVLLPLGISRAWAQSSDSTGAASSSGERAAAVQPVSPGVSTTGSGGSAYQYCDATINSSGTIAFVGYAGSLDLNQQSFALYVTGVPIHPSAIGMFTYGVHQTEVPFGNGFLCINPYARMSVQHLTGETVFMTMTSSPEEFAPFQPSSSWNFQFWYRDAQGGGAGFNLSRALHVDFAP